MQVENSCWSRITRSQLIRDLMLLIILSMIPLGTPSRISCAQDGKPKGTVFRKLEPNLYSPQLYAEKLKIKFSLVDLPGSKDARSTWEVSYRLYFISEAEHVKSTI